MKEKLLLHVCCAPCAIYPLDQLAEKYELTIFFYDPNIHPRKEYNQRLEEIKKYAKKKNIAIEEGDYDTAEWFSKTKGMENEPERGKRCDTCFDMRLSKTAAKASVEKYDIWATALTISPHKDAAKINIIGKKLSQTFGVDFLTSDWKKKDGFKIATQMSKDEGFYRQDYCGCVYSKKERKKKNETNENILI